MSESNQFSGSDAKRAARNVSALVIASVISKGTLFVWQLVLFGWLGAHNYGIYGTVGGLMVIAGSITSFGMSLIVIRDVAREPQKAGSYWSAMLFWQAALGLVAYLGINSFSVVYDETLRAFVALAGLNLFVDLFGNMGYDLLLAREEMLKTSLSGDSACFAAHWTGRPGARPGLGIAGNLCRLNIVRLNSLVGLGGAQPA